MTVKFSKLRKREEKAELVITEAIKKVENGNCSVASTLISTKETAQFCRTHAFFTKLLTKFKVTYYWQFNFHTKNNIKSDYFLYLVVHYQ